MRSGLLAKAEEVRAAKEGDAKYPVPASIFYPDIDVLGEARRDRRRRRRTGTRRRTLDEPGRGRRLRLEA